nr:tissue factor pathway inhibitor 2-like [Rhipicephalus microplus]
MGLLIHCHALAMCIAIVSGLKETIAQNQIGENGPTANSDAGGLHFLPGHVPGSGNGSAIGGNQNDLPHGNINNENSNTTAEEPTGKIGGRPSRCYKPPVQGVCRAFIPTWYFDHWSFHCKIFIYGGCGGNRNQFRSEKKCQEVCLPKKRVKLVCSLKPEVGSRYNRRKWVFDADKGTCYKLGKHQYAQNANGFPTCWLCMKRCSHLKARAGCASARGPNSTQQQQQEMTTGNIPPNSTMNNHLPE